MIALLGLSIIIPLGSELVSIMRLKFSSYSTTSSSYNEMLNNTLVTPAGKVTLYGPEV